MTSTWARGGAIGERLHYNESHDISISHSIFSSNSVRGGDLGCTDNPVTATAGGGAVSVNSASTITGSTPFFLPSTLLFRFSYPCLLDLLRFSIHKQ